jgi:hypothetical protein
MLPPMRRTARCKNIAPHDLSRVPQLSLLQEPSASASVAGSIVPKQAVIGRSGRRLRVLDSISSGVHPLPRFTQDDACSQLRGGGRPHRPSVPDGVPRSKSAATPAYLSGSRGKDSLLLCSQERAKCSAARHTSSPLPARKTWALYIASRVSARQHYDDLAVPLASCRRDLSLMSGRGFIVE